MKELKTLEDLEPAPYNPRKISSKSKKGLSKSIEKYGDISGITWNRRTGRLVTGHQRVNQLREAGAQIIGDELVLKDSRFKVRVVDWPESKEKEANGAANNPFIQGDWSDSANEFLKDLHLSMSPEDFGDMGFDLLADSLKIDLKMPDEIEEPEIPEPPKDSITKLGDVWELGDHVLVCGDSLDEESYTDKVSLWLTDPPYNLDYTGKTKDALKIQNDKMDDSTFREFLRSAFSRAFSSMLPGAVFYVWHADSEGHNFRWAVFDCGEAVRQCLIWKKDVLVMCRQDYQWQHEACLYGWKSGGAHGWYSDRKQTTILEFGRPKSSEEHPTMKPIALFAYQVSNSCAPGGLVLDNFAGSGTTAIACEQLGRKSHSIELDPAYCDVIIQRWEDLTGGAAKRRTS